jgi:Spy/CpxP family protein refolding chaperone
MTRTAIFTLLLSTFISVAFAQSNGGMPPAHQMLASPDAFADGHLAALDKQVGLSAEQKPQLRDVFLQEGKDVFTVFGNKSLSDTQKQAKIQQIYVATRGKVWSLLTQEQRKQMSEQPAPPRPVT